MENLLRKTEPELMYAGTKALYFTIDGAPVAQGRPRFSTKSRRAFDPKKSAENKQYIRLVASMVAQQEHWEICHKDMPVSVKLSIFKSIPTMAKWKRVAAERGYLVPTSKTGDIENIAKGVMDAMTGVVYEDDCQVFKLDCEVRYSTRPRIVVSVVGYFQNYGDIKDAVSAKKIDEVKQ